MGWRRDLACARCGGRVADGGCPACRRLRATPGGPPREAVAALLAVLALALAALGLEAGLVPAAP
ncbi:hypothetical protein D5H78_12390 [Vallicoccus soli]|uniref:Uncharacterized protein n=1 Tax=Vallicoccus soli TaxID=2339232 RepID=A0A3A3YYT9_9ACTN|nr:hypothetical protein D5H78_12390 [Vallicoccus soli]